jgi:hypothetical protein
MGLGIYMIRKFSSILLPSFIFSFGACSFFVEKIGSSCGDGIAETGEVCFSSQRTRPVSLSFRSFTLGDLNNDDRVDVLLVHSLSHRVSVSLQKLDGNFDIPIPFLVAPASPVPFPFNATLADLDNDGDLDVAVACPELIVDIDGDGIVDNSAVSILMNDGDGFLSAPVLLPIGFAPLDVAAGDIDQDNDLDLLTVNVRSSFGGVTRDSKLGFLRNKGDATFETAEFLEAGINSIEIELSDLNGDQFLDIVDLDNGEGALGVTFNDGAGNFPQSGRNSLSTGLNSNPQGLAVSDFDQDGNVDIVVSRFNNNDIILFRNDSGSFALKDRVAVDNAPFLLRAADVDSDGFPDIVLLHNNFDNLIERSVSVLLSDSVSFSSESVAIGTDPANIEIADINNDNFLDIVVSTLNDNELDFFRSTP